MFVSQAHSFTRQARFVLKLAGVAGYTNMLTLLTCGTVTSHMSGATSALGERLAKGEWSAALFPFAIVLTFFMGASLCGVLEEWGRRAEWRARYVAPLAIEMVLLAMLAIVFELYAEHLQKGGPFTYVACAASFAMGLQNATVTRISGGVIRTTHVTGVVTDLGLELAQILGRLWDQSRSQPHAASDKTRMMNIHSPRRFMLLAAIFGCFAAGAILGTLAFMHAAKVAMWLPVAVLALTIWQDVRMPFVSENERQRGVKAVPGKRLGAKSD